LILGVIQSPQAHSRLVTFQGKQARKHNLRSYIAFLIAAMQGTYVDPTRMDCDGRILRQWLAVMLQLIAHIRAVQTAATSSGDIVQPKLSLALDAVYTPTATSWLLRNRSVRGPTTNGAAAHGRGRKRCHGSLPQQQSCMFTHNRCSKRWPPCCQTWSAVQAISLRASEAGRTKPAMRLRILPSPTLHFCPCSETTCFICRCWLPGHANLNGREKSSDVRWS